MKKRELKRQLRNALAISDNWRRAALAAHREVKNPQDVRRDRRETQDVRRDRRETQDVVETDVDKWLDWQKFIKPL